MERYGPDTSIRLLLVEDDTESGEAVRSMLRKRGLGVGMVRSAEQALEQFAAAEWDIVVADIRLGGITGVELLERIRPDWLPIQLNRRK